jgi:predicted nucleotidyltransferase
MTKEEIKETLIANKEILQKYKVRSIALVDSSVQAKEKENSDIDFLVEFDTGVTLLDLVDLEDNLAVILGKSISIVSKKVPNTYLGAPYSRGVETLVEGL